MKRFLLSFAVLIAFATTAFAAKNTVLLHPGDTIYARFEVDGKKIRLANAGPEKDEAAQVTFSFAKDVEGMGRRLKVENRFPHDLVYKVEMRSLTLNHQQRVPSTPIVGGKVGFDEYPPGVEQLALFDFKIQP